MKQPSRLSIIGMMALLAMLAGCAAYSPAPAKLDEKIAAALEDAATAKHKPAPAEMARLQEALLPPLTMEMPQVAARLVEPRFDLVVNNAPAQQVFTSIVSGTRYSMLIHPNVSGAISVSLKDVTVREALDSIRQVYGYEYTIEGTRVHILPAGLQTRVFHVNYLIGARQGRSDMRVSTRPSSTGATGAPGATGTSASGSLTAVNIATQTSPPSMMPTGAGALGGFSNDASQMATIQLTDFWAELSVSLRSMLGNADGRSVVISPQSGVVVVRALAHELRSVETFLKAMQASVERQVMLEAKIIDVTLKDSYQAGVNWAAFPTTGIAVGFSNTDASVAALSTTGALVGSNAFAQPGSRVLGALGAGIATATNPAGVFGLALQTSNFAALLEFLESQGSVQVLSSPRVATLNNQKAVIKVGVDEPFSGQSPGTQATSTTAGSTPTNTLTSVFSGISLDILPQIDSNGNITLHVHPVISQVRRAVIRSGSGTETIEAPQVDISESDTVVRTTDGSIIALGGLMRVEMSDNRGGVPGLSGMPGIGAAFRNVGKGSVKRELVILIKPTVIQSDADSSEEIRQARERITGMMPAPAGRQK